jgi:hypothetical protein
MIILKTQFTNDVEKNLSSKKSLHSKPTIYKTFDKKANAISYIKESENDLKLFSEDLSDDDGCKRFIVSTYDKIYDLSKDKQHHMYENYEADQPLKLILDIDFKKVFMQHFAYRMLMSYVPSKKQMKKMYDIYVIKILKYLYHYNSNYINELNKKK